ncbi:chemotaxis protein CheW [[Clostridium] fimetarium]|uniref:Purine-binding chemotaxis protein CheW n=1 Tax=[Clostridium] fimetarium TaxID=99656 RepID=A0A1I0R878_9FIRM|nr:chemotaxis protein CheW [[Clostridium] fimetarium]SEW36730.1 purine-binding chemotaxis protein CheW [[Clostridium] fimetarium]
MANYFKPVIFKLGSESYGIDINLVSSIEKQVNVVAIPNTVPYMKGIINLRNEVIPVINLKKKFNMKDSDILGENAIIVKLPNITIALEVDSVEEIHSIDESEIVDMPTIVKTGDLKYFDKVVNVNGKLVVLINAMYLLSESEQTSVVSLTEKLN